MRKINPTQLYEGDPPFQQITWGFNPTQLYEGDPPFQKIPWAFNPFNPCNRYIVVRKLRPGRRKNPNSPVYPPLDNASALNPIKPPEPATPTLMPGTTGLNPLPNTKTPDPAEVTQLPGNSALNPKPPEPATPTHSAVYNPRRWYRIRHPNPILPEPPVNIPFPSQLNPYIPLPPPTRGNPILPFPPNIPFPSQLNPRPPTKWLNKMVAKLRKTYSHSTSRHGRITSNKRLTRMAAAIWWHVLDEPMRKRLIAYYD